MTHFWKLIYLPGRSFQDALNINRLFICITLLALYSYGLECNNFVEILFYRIILYCNVLYAILKFTILCSCIHWDVHMTKDFSLLLMISVSLWCTYVWPLYNPILYKKIRFLAILSFDFYNFNELFNLYFYQMTY